MNEMNHAPALLRKRKMLLVLPVLVIPFITLAFWSMGGGKGSGADHPAFTMREGLNLQLPDASFKDDPGMNKLGYYEKAAHDSARREELLRNDPYYKINALRTSSNPSVIPDSNEEKVTRKLAELDKAMNTRNSVSTESLPYNTGEKKQQVIPSPEVDRLEHMMQLQQNAAAPDPEMNQLNGMLDKIMDIQHPERLTEQARPHSVKQPAKAYPVDLDTERNNITLLVSETESRSPLYNDTGFYSVNKNGGGVSNDANAIEAVIHETRTIVNGTIIKLRLLTDVFINGALIPKGNFIYGRAALNGERLNITISSVHYQHSLYPVSLAVYDMDGMDGVYVPGAITRDATKESSDRAIQGLALNSLDPSLGAQAASAGIEAAKNLLARKVKLIRVVVKAGYKVLLKASP